MIVDKLFIKQLRKSDCVRLMFDDETLTVETSQRDGAQYFNTTGFHYSKRYKTLSYTMPDCHFYSSFSEITGWQALGKLIRVNDELRFFVFDGGCKSIRDAGIFVDVLSVEIIRNGKRYIERLYLDTDYATETIYRAVKSDLSKH